jgi:gluconate 2-dehydrogenase gamma chain
MPGPADPTHTRRTFLRTTAGALGWTAVAARWPGLARAAEEARRIAAGEAPPTLRTFTEAEAAEVEAVAALIIPTDDTPGAREAGAVYFIDRALADYMAPAAADFRAGLDDLRRRLRSAHPGATSINELGSEDAIEFLRSVEDTPFLRSCRDLTVMGTLANPALGGNRDGSGWSAIGFVDRHAWQPPFGYYDARARETGR